MNKENYIEIINEKIKNKNSKQIMINQINNYYDSKANYKKKKHNYKIDDQVLLKKGTLLHGTFKNIEIKKTENSVSAELFGIKRTFECTLPFSNGKHDITTENGKIIEIH